MLDDDVYINLVNWEDFLWTAVNEFFLRKEINDELTPSWIDRELRKTYLDVRSNGSVNHPSNEPTPPGTYPIAADLGKLWNIVISQQDLERTLKK